MRTSGQSLGMGAQYFSAGIYNECLYHVPTFLINKKNVIIGSRSTLLYAIDLDKRLVNSLAVSSISVAR